MPPSIQELAELLVNPLIPNKKQILGEIYEIYKNKLMQGRISYFCTLCGYSHKKGEIYRKHLNYANLKLKLPAVKLIQMQKTIYTSIYTETGKFAWDERIAGCVGYKLYLRKLRCGLVGVYGKRWLLGYLSKKKSEMLSDTLANQPDNINAVLWHEKPNNSRNRSWWVSSYNYKYFWSNKRMRVKITILDWNKALKLIKGMIEMQKLGIPNVERALFFCPPQIRRLFEIWAEDTGCRELLKRFHAQYEQPSVQISTGRILL